MCNFCGRDGEEWFWSGVARRGLDWEPKRFGNDYCPIFAAASPGLAYALDDLERHFRNRDALRGAERHERERKRKETRFRGLTDENEGSCF